MQCAWWYVVTYMWYSPSQCILYCQKIHLIPWTLGVLRWCLWWYLLNLSTSASGDICILDSTIQLNDVSQPSWCSGAHRGRQQQRKQWEGERKHLQLCLKMVSEEQLCLKISMKNWTLSEQPNFYSLYENAVWRTKLCQNNQTFTALYENAAWRTKPCLKNRTLSEEQNVVWR